jgi:hypothetical protein
MSSADIEAMPLPKCLRNTLGFYSPTRKRR